MQVKKATKPEDKELLVRLGNVASGKIIRFPEFTFEEAISGKDEAGFFMVTTAMKPEVAARINVMSLDGKVILVRDADRLVVEHEAEISIKPAI